MVKRKVTNILGPRLALSTCPWYNSIDVALASIGSINAMVAATAFDNFDVVGTRRASMQLMTMAVLISLVKASTSIYKVCCQANEVFGS